MSTTTMNRPVSAAEPAPLEAPTGIPFARLLRVEWGKATDTRAARWLLALVALSTTGFMLIPLLAHDVEQSFTSYLSSASAVQIMLAVVAILTLTSEWSQRTVLTTFTQEPRRIRVVLAKVAVSVLLGAAGALFGLLVTVAALAVAAGMGRHVDVDPSAGVILGFALFVLLNVLSGVAIAALLHNTAAAIVAYFALPITFLLTGHAVAFVQEWIDSTTTFNWLLLGEPGGHWPQITASTLLWVVAPLTAGLVRTVRREITWSISPGRFACLVRPLTRSPRLYLPSSSTRLSSFATCSKAISGTRASPAMYRRPERWTTRPSPSRRRIASRIVALNTPNVRTSSVSAGTRGACRRSRGDLVGRLSGNRCGRLGATGRP
jgi:ABC-2 type transport system permease protein